MGVGDRTLSTDLFVFNGINGATGDYLNPNLHPIELSQIARREKINVAHLQDLRHKFRRSKKVYRGPMEGVDPLRLEEAGWGVIFAHGSGPAIKEALSELLLLRQSQAGNRYKEFEGVNAYRPGESKRDFLRRFNVGPGPVDPTRVPYYLLIVGGPEEISFEFQYQLDVQYAVGRIHFDTLEEYAAYAHSVARAENRKLPRPRQAAFFGVSNHDDRPTNLSATRLVQPLAERMTKGQPDWQVRTIFPEEATKERLNRLLGGEETPDFLFTASHGLGFPNGDPRQIPHQGALVCQDWPGPSTWQGALKEDFYFSADDIGQEAQLAGLVTFHFACFGAGTPKIDYFSRQAFREPEPIAPYAFVAPLPKRMLGHAKGGVLAAIGHVDRAWGYSFMWDQAGEQLQTFESAFKRLLEGHPIGSAMEYFSQRYAELSTELSQLTDISRRGDPDEYELARIWTANNDARSYVIIGDPAVRLTTSE